MIGSCIKGWSNIKHILMLATGGTIASRESGHGLSPSITSEEILRCVPEIGNLCEVETLQLLNLDSTNTVPENWLQIAGAIEAYNMTLEAAVTKLMWILGQTEDIPQIQRLFYQSIQNDLIR